MTRRVRRGMHSCKSHLTHVTTLVESPCVSSAAACLHSAATQNRAEVARLVASGIELSNFELKRSPSISRGNLVRHPVVVFHPSRFGAERLYPV
jgi:hypothetical protein